MGRSVEAVEAAMAAYEKDPLAFGRSAGAEPVDTAHLEAVAGFQDNEGPMFERPAGAGVKGRFKYGPGGKAAAFGGS